MRKITHLWGSQRQELDAFLREFVQRGCPVIPVLLADAPQEHALPVFLRAMTWVDFRRQNPIRCGNCSEELQANKKRPKKHMLEGTPQRRMELVVRICVSLK